MEAPRGPARRFPPPVTAKSEVTRWPAPSSYALCGPGCSLATGGDDGSVPKETRKPGLQHRETKPPGRPRETRR